jgi:sec-independent protein translocase protein TatC
MTVPSELETALISEPIVAAIADLPIGDRLDQDSQDDDMVDQDAQEKDVEMSLFDHLDELRLRIFYALIAVGIGMIGCFSQVKPLVKFLQVPAQGVRFLQLAPGEFFFVSIKVAGYSGLVLAAPFILYQIIAFVTPGLTQKEKRILAPIVLGSGVLFLGGLAFAYVALIPAALNFFITYGEEVVEQAWSIERYFELILLLMFSTGIAFQVPIVQAILGFLGIISSRQMFAAWRYVLVGAALAGAILTPSTDPLTQSLLAGAVLVLYFAGIGIVKMMGK